MCDSVLAVRPADVKALHRRAMARIELGQYRECEDDLVAARNLAPEGSTQASALETLHTKLQLVWSEARRSWGRRLRQRTERESLSDGEDTANGMPQGVARGVNEESSGHGGSSAWGDTRGMRGSGDDDDEAEGHELDGDDAASSSSESSDSSEDESESDSSICSSEDLDSLALTMGSDPNVEECDECDDSEEDEEDDSDDDAINRAQNEHDDAVDVCAALDVS
jgi:hypothetical protein